MNDVRFSTPYIIIYNTSIKHTGPGAPIIKIIICKNIFTLFNGFYRLQEQYFLLYLYHESQ